MTNLQDIMYMVLQKWDEVMHIDVSRKEINNIYAEIQTLIKWFWMHCITPSKFNIGVPGRSAALTVLHIIK